MNKQSFDLSKPNGKKHFNNLLNVLFAYNEDRDNEDYYEIHIYPSDCEYITIEWENTPWGSNKEWGGSFKWVSVYDEVYTEVHFPDDHYEMVPVGSENEVLKEWHKDHPEWVMTPYGTWTNKEENLD